MTLYNIHFVKKGIMVINIGSKKFNQFT